MGRNTNGLTRGDDRALAALGVERLRADETTWVTRVRGPEQLRERLRSMSPAEIGQVLEHALRDQP